MNGDCICATCALWAVHKAKRGREGLCKRRTVQAASNAMPRLPTLADGVEFILSGAFQRGLSENAVMTAPGDTCPDWKATRG